MNGYLGEKVLDWRKVPEYADYNPEKWALEYICRYGSIDGAHHKDWVLDQVSRILLGTEILLSEASWDNGHTEYRIKLDKPSQTYHDWVKEITEDGEYGYEEGIAP